MSKAKELLSVVAEATGESGPEKLDAKNFGHLEVGVDYTIKYRDHSFEAEFLDWVDDNGEKTDKEDPAKVQLRFNAKDPKGDYNFQLYWDADEGCYCIGTSSDPVTVEVVSDESGDDDYVPDELENESTDDPMERAFGIVVVALDSYLKERGVKMKETPPNVIEMETKGGFKFKVTVEVVQNDQQS